MNCNNNQNNNNGCGCNCNPHPTPAPESVDINMSVCDRNINMLPMLQTYTTKVLKPNIEGCCKKNILKQCMMNCENYKYVIKWDFDLNGETITVPENCILEFDGGSLKNGTIIGQDTVFINVGDVEIWGEGLIRQGTWKEHSGGGGGGSHEEDRPYNPSEFVGMGKKYLQKNVVDGRNILTQGMISEANTIYVVQYDFDLNEREIQIPTNCVLEFDGGSFSNGKLISNDTLLVGKCDSSYNSLFGVFYDINRNPLGWDKNIIKNWKTSIEFGNFVNGVEPGVNFGYNQSMVMDENYIYLLFTKEYIENETALDHVTVVLYDRSFNYLGYSQLSRPCHANGATIYDGHIYIACCGKALDDDTIHVVDIETLVFNCRSNKGESGQLARITSVEPVRLGFGITSIDYDPVTDTFALGQQNPAYRICDTSFNTIKISEIGDYRNYGVDKFGRRTTTQDFVYQNGLLYILDWDYKYPEGDLPSISSVLYVIDVATDKVIQTQPVNFSLTGTESEGVCKDPVTGLLYVSCNNHNYYNGSLIFSVHTLSYNNDNVDNSTRQNIENPHWINDGIGVKVSVDNLYIGKSSGTAQYPYKSLGEAFVMAGNIGRRIEFGLAYTGIPYYLGDDIHFTDVVLRLFGESLGGDGEYPEIDGNIRFRNSTVNIENIHFKPSDKHGARTYILDFNQHCNARITYTKFTNAASSNFGRAILAFNHNYITVDDVSFDDAHRIDVSHILLTGPENTVAIREVTLENGNVINPGDSVADSSLANRIAFKSPANLHLNGDSLAIASTSRTPYNHIIGKAINNVEDFAAVKALFTSAAGNRTLVYFSIAFFLSVSVTVDGITYRPGWYTNDEFNGELVVRSLDDSSKIFGGSLCDTLAHLPAGIHGQTIFCLEINKPMWNDGTRWITWDDAPQSDWNEIDTTSKAYIRNKPVPDSALDPTSDNPVKNKVIAQAFSEAAAEASRVNNQLISLNGTVTELQDDLNDDHYTKSQIDNLLSNTPESDTVIVPTVADLQNIPLADRANKVFRVPGTNTFSEYGWDGSNFIKLDEKNYGIDNEPVYESDNVPTSGAVKKALDDETDDTVKETVSKKLYMITGTTTAGNHGWVNTDANCLTSEYLPLNGCNDIHYRVANPNLIPEGYKIYFKAVTYISDKSDYVQIKDWTVKNHIHIDYSAVYTRVTFHLIKTSDSSEYGPFTLEEFNSFGITLYVGNVAYTSISNNTLSDRLAETENMALDSENSIKAVVNSNSVEIATLNVGSTVNATGNINFSSSTDCHTYFIPTNNSPFIKVDINQPQAGYEIRYKVLPYDENYSVKRPLNWRKENVIKLQSFGNLYPSDKDAWIDGNIDIPSGKYIGAPTRCMTKNFINIKGVDKLKVTLNNTGFYDSVKLVYYDKDFNYVGQSEWVETVNTETTFTPEYNYEYMKIVLGTPDGTPIYTLENIENAASVVADGTPIKWVKLSFLVIDLSDSSEVNPLPLDIMKNGNISITVGNKTYSLETNVLPSNTTNDATFVARGGLIIASWNIGHFAFGDSPNTVITESKHEYYKKLFKYVINKLDADLFSLCEYSSVFSTDSGSGKLAKNVLFEQYPYKYEGHQNQYACQAIYGYRPLGTVTETNITSVQTTHYYSVANIVVNGVNVKFVSIHFQWDHSTPPQESFERAQFTEIVNAFANDSHVIICGDFNNLYLRNVVEIFGNAGYEIANGGKFGKFETWSRTKEPDIDYDYEVDNIVCKGFDICGVDVFQTDLSDHHPIRCKLMIKS